jgi:WD40 repeat protein
MNFAGTSGGFGGGGGNYRGGGGFQSGRGRGSRGGAGGGNGYQGGGHAQGGGYNGGGGGGYQGSGGGGGGGGYRGSGTRGRGAPRGRGGRGRGAGGGGGANNLGPGGMLFANDVAAFDAAVDAHVNPQQPGVQALCAWPENSTVFTGGLDGSVRMFNVNDGSSTDVREGREVSSLLLFQSWLFVGYLNQPTPGMDVGFVKSYNFGVSPPENYNFEMDASFPAAHRARVSSICVAGELVFTGGEDGAVRAWKLEGGKQWKLVGSLGGAQAHGCPVRKVACVGGFVYTGAFNGEVKVWSLDGNLVSQFQAHQDMVTDICGWGSVEQSVVLTCSADCTIRVWQVAGGFVPANSQPVFSYPPAEVKFKPKGVTSMVTTVLQDGRSVLIIGTIDGSVRVLDLPDFTDLGFLSGHQRTAPITSLVVVPTASNALLFAGSLNGQLNCFRLIA